MPLKHLIMYFVLSASTGALAQSTGFVRDGSHDFDFSRGSWKTEITIIKDPFKRPSEEVHMRGTKSRARSGTEGAGSKRSRRTDPADIGKRQTSSSTIRQLGNGVRITSTVPTGRWIARTSAAIGMAKLEFYSLPTGRRTVGLGARHLDHRQSRPSQLRSRSLDRRRSDMAHILHCPREPSEMSCSLL